MGAFSNSPGGCCCAKWGAFAQNYMGGTPTTIVYGPASWVSNFNSTFPRTAANGAARRVVVGEYIENANRRFHFITLDASNGPAVSWYCDIDSQTFTPYAAATHSQWREVRRVRVTNEGTMIGLRRGFSGDQVVGVITGPLDLSTATSYPNPPATGGFKHVYTNETGLTKSGYTFSNVRTTTSPTSDIANPALYQNDSLITPAAWLNDTNAAGNAIQATYFGGCDDEAAGAIVVSKILPAVRNLLGNEDIAGSSLRVGAWVYNKTNGSVLRTIQLPAGVPSSTTLSSSIAYDGESIYMATQHGMLRADGDATEFEIDALPASTGELLRGGLVLLPF